MQPKRHTAICSHQNLKRSLHTFLVLRAFIAYYKCYRTDHRQSTFSHIKTAYMRRKAPPCAFAIFQGTQRMKEYRFFSYQLTIVNNLPIKQRELAHWSIRLVVHHILSEIMVESSKKKKKEGERSKVHILQYNEKIVLPPILCYICFEQYGRKGDATVTCGWALRAD